MGPVAEAGEWVAKGDEEEHAARGTGRAPTSRRRMCDRLSSSRRRSLSSASCRSLCSRASALSRNVACRIAAASEPAAHRPDGGRTLGAEEAAAVAVAAAGGGAAGAGAEEAAVGSEDVCSPAPHIAAGISWVLLSPPFEEAEAEETHPKSAVCAGAWR